MEKRRRTRQNPSQKWSTVENRYASEKEKKEKTIGERYMAYLPSPSEPHSPHLSGLRSAFSFVALVAAEKETYLSELFGERYKERERERVVGWGKTKLPKPSLHNPHPTTFMKSAVMGSLGCLKFHVPQLGLKQDHPELNHLRYLSATPSSSSQKFTTVCGGLRGGPRKPL
ncbi:hypothetical protein C1H46_016101 [Malus baccata]|uniref:Uncharacterized protein n=1 Tax=Malus baccata TaxID=106549 RepID=A0A540MHM1_MALBA|nr:hypothetical protein C1H46_016101 [Malus baccata]